MPFDGPNQVKFGWFARLFHRHSVTSRSQARTRRARELSHLLRHRELWPAGFVWSYWSHRTCAIGLAERQWYIPGSMASTSLGRKLGMPDDVAYSIFIGLNKSSIEEITPEHVADAIDAYLVPSAAKGDQ